MITWLGKINCGTNSRFKSKSRPEGMGYKAQGKEPALGLLIRAALAKRQRILSLITGQKAEYLGIDSNQVDSRKRWDMACGVPLAAYSILFCFSYLRQCFLFHHIFLIWKAESLCRDLYFLLQFLHWLHYLAMFSIPSKYLSPPNLSLAVTSPLSFRPMHSHAFLTFLLE